MEIVRRAYDALSRHDFNTFKALHDPDVELTPLRPEGATYRGHDGVRRYWDELFDVFPDFNVEIDDVREGRGSDVSSPRVSAGAGRGATCPSDNRSGSSARYVVGGSSGGAATRVRLRPSKPPAFSE